MFLTVSPLVSVLRSSRKYMGSAGSRRLVLSPAIGYFNLKKRKSILNIGNGEGNYSDTILIYFYAQQVI